MEKWQNDASEFHSSLQISAIDSMRGWKPLVYKAMCYENLDEQIFTAVV